MQNLGTSPKSLNVFEEVLNMNFWKNYQQELTLMWNKV